MSGYLPEKTIRYKTYLKTAVVQAFKDVFQHHVDDLLKQTKVSIDYPRSAADYPALLVRFFERDISNAGVGHVEHISVDGPDGQEIGDSTYPFKHYFYKGDLEYAIFGLSSLDRDLISDSVVQTLGMGELQEYTNRFFTRIYPDERTGAYPDSIWHYININVDQIRGFGETQSPTPWGSEDDLMYQTSYRTPVFGEFYSVPPDTPNTLIQKVTQYPYIKDLEPVPTGDPDDQAQWQPPLGF